MFVDASTIIAILTAAPQADALADALEKARSPITSPIAVVEAVQGIRRLRHSSVPEAQLDVNDFLKIAGVRSVSISIRDAEVALDAMSRYGEGSSHPAQLSLSDCFSYAISRNYKAPLLHNSQSFELTDLDRASA